MRSLVSFVSSSSGSYDMGKRDFATAKEGIKWHQTGIEKEMGRKRRLLVGHIVTKGLHGYSIWNRDQD